MVKKLNLKRAPKEDNKVEEAQQAVARYENSLQEYLDMREEFERKYPEAVQQFALVKEAEDRVNGAIAEAKRLVALAKTSVGEFQCQRAFSSEGYDEQAVVDICVREGEWDLLCSLFENGIVKKVAFDKDLAKAWFDRHPSDATLVAPAWKEKSELTPRVFTPKFG